MSGISTIVFNGSNAYELSLGDKATSWPQGALGIEQVSAGVQLRSPTAGAGAILRIRAIGTNGLLISELSQTHILTVQNNWERAEKTFTLPAGTVKIELRLVAVGGAILFAQPKLANGASVGAYATNFAPQLTMITPTGIYTGTVTAEQIILTGGERLPDRLLTLNANIVSLRQGINGSDAKIASLTADMLSFSDTMSGKTSKLTADGLYTSTINAEQIEGGTIKATAAISYGPFVQADLDKVADHITRVRLLTDAEMLKYDINADGHVTTADYIGILNQINGVSPPVRNVKPAIRIQPRSLDFEGGIFFGTGDDINTSNSQFYMSKGEFRGRLLTVSDAEVGSLKTNVISGIGVSSGLSFRQDDVWAHKMAANYLESTILESTIVSTGNIETRDSGGLHMFDSAGRLRLSYDVNATYLRSPNGNQLGVDNGGVYKIVHGTKTYL